MPGKNFEGITGGASGYQDESVDDGSAILPGIEHIVVLMFENRSFDNVLGGLYPDKSQADYNGLSGAETNPLDPCSPQSPRIPVFQGPTELDTMVMPNPDPGELFNDMNEQIFGCCSPTQYASGECPDTGTEVMQGFVSNYLRQPATTDVPPIPPVANHIMQYYKPGPSGPIPITSALAQQYAVSDEWFASGPVQTLANRFFVHCATPSTYRDQNNDIVALKDNTELTDKHTDPDGSVSDKSIYELLDHAAKRKGWLWPHRDPWKVYYHDWPLAALVKYVDDHWSPLFGGRVYDFNDLLGGFADDVGNGKLPTYSFIEPRYTDTIPFTTPNSNHPGGATVSGNPPAISICPGEQLLQSVYKILFNGPDQLFEKTLFIVNYDEHGGLYDHVGPPPAVSPFPPGTVQGFDYNRYGVRIPNIFINPFIQPHTIFRPRAGGPPFDHTSIISTLRKQFGLRGNLTRRDAVAPTFAGLIDTGNKLNPFTPDDLPDVECPAQKSVTVAAEALSRAPRRGTIGEVIKKAILSPRNQMRVARMSRPKL